MGIGNIIFIIFIILFVFVVVFGMYYTEKGISDFCESQGLEHDFGAGANCYGIEGDYVIKYKIGHYGGEYKFIK